jgi:asparagine synthase (glutamine-hydrolysing)
VKEHELTCLAGSSRCYAPDGTFVHAAGNIGMGFQPYHTTERSHLEAQPATDGRGHLLVFDGRLDNHEDLRRELDMRQLDISDSQLILASFRRWGEACFSRLIGDWAIALWSELDHLLFLARDHAGARTLYFRNTNGGLAWSTYLDHFAAEEDALRVDQQYAASYLGSLPVGDLTPYPGVRAVPPAHHLVIHDGKITSKAHWKWMLDSRVRYKTDAEYESHFRSLFKKSVERRTVPGSPLVAQLSGGMDSTSIVCMSDHIRRSANPTAELVDTLSFYDDSEPDWNERPYFSLTETRRGKLGIHLDMSCVNRTLKPSDLSQAMYMFPGPDSETLEYERRLQSCLGPKGYRVILSGIGGDELLGGVPSPSPELADYLVAGKFKRLMTQATAWCLANRTPLLHELLNTGAFALDLYRAPHIDRTKTPPWIKPDLRQICIELGRRHIGGSGHFGLLPSAVCNGQAWWITLETLPHLVPSLLTRYEYRYPYLDRELVDFLFSIPRDQLVRPGRRRSLMRRALKGIVPVEILERRRKAFIRRGPLAWLQANKDQIEEMFADSCSVDYGFVDPAALRSALQLTVQGVDVRWRRALMKTVAFELWLRAQREHRATIRRDARINEFVHQQGRADKLHADEIAV